MKKILVTGGAGFIGSNLIRILLKDPENHILCLDNYDPAYSPELKRKNIEPFLSHVRFESIVGDIRSRSILDSLKGINVIVHLAAKAGVRPSISNPDLYLDVNVKGTQNLLEYAKDNNIRQFVFASSSSVYGTNDSVPWKETDSLMPISQYALTKLSGESLGHVYSHLYGIRFIALRLFTVYGPGQRPDLVIHKIFKAINGNEEFDVYGDGSSSRDYTYVQDIVDGIISAISYQASMFETINLGNNCVTLLRDLITSIETLCNKKAISKPCDNQPGDVRITCANIHKAKELLGYNPSVTLKDGLVRFNEWLLLNHRAGKQTETNYYL